MIVFLLQSYSKFSQPEWKRLRVVFSWTIINPCCLLAWIPKQSHIHSTIFLHPNFLLPQTVCRQTTKQPPPATILHLIGVCKGLLPAATKEQRRYNIIAITTLREIVNFNRTVIQEERWSGWNSWKCPKFFRWIGHYCDYCARSVLPLSMLPGALVPSAAARPKKKFNYTFSHYNRLQFHGNPFAQVALLHYQSTRTIAAIQPIQEALNY